MNSSGRIIDLQSRAVITVAGADWRSFLQGLLTNDVETLKAGEAQFAALLTPQGRIAYDLFVVGAEDGCLLDVAAHHRDAIIARLSMYRLRAKVRIEASPLRVIADLDGVGGVRDPRLAALGSRHYEMVAQGAPEAAYDAHRLHLGVPATADWDDEATYPIEADFDLLNGIDFKKGCFVGQETTSRMKRRGAIRSRMLPIAFDGPALPYGTEILAGDLRAGQVLSGMAGRAIALVRLDRIAGAPLSAGGVTVAVGKPEWLAE